MELRDFKNSIKHWLGCPKHNLGCVMNSGAYIFILSTADALASVPSLRHVLYRASKI